MMQLVSHFQLLLLVLPSQSSHSADYEEALVEPPGAYNLVHGSESGTKQVSYRFDEPYPARSFLERLNHSLTELGWRPLKESWFNPGSPTSHESGWSHFQDGTSQTDLRVDQWMAEWTHADGAVLSYVLKYSYPLRGEPVRDSLSVTAIVLSPEAARTFQIQAEALAGEVRRTLEVGEEASRAQEQRDAATLRRGATSMGRLLLRLLRDSPTAEPTEVASLLFDEEIAPLELDVVRAAVESDGGSQAVIRVVFSQESAKDLHRFSAMHVGRSTAVIVAEEVVATPFIAAPVADIMVIHGAFSQVRANEIAERIMN
jgi:hypothetical protein